MNIEIIDELETEESAGFADILRLVAETAGQEELGREDFEVEIILTDGPGIRQVNAEHRGIDSETDVLSFPLWNRNEGEEPEINPENGCIMLGDILISLPRVKEQAEEYGHSARREAAYLCVHGMLHLMGYDHMVEEDKTVMRAREEELLTKMKFTRED